MDSKLILIFIISVAFFIAGCITPDIPVCGNGICETGEFAETCPADCTTSTTSVVIELYDGQGYPYDPNNTTGVYDYTVSITANGNNLQAIKISNSRDKWSSSTSNGPLYPGKLAQSLTGNMKVTEALFGQALKSSTPGYGYAKVNFPGWQELEEMSTVEIGKVSGLSTDAIGGLTFRGYDDALHTIPMAMELNWGADPGTFTFDGQTIWYDLNLSSRQNDSTITGTNDLNFIVSSGDYINNRLVTISTSGTTATITFSGESAVTKSVGQYVNFHNVQFRVERILSSTSIIMSADLSLELRKNSGTGTLLLNTSGNSTGQTYGKFYFNDDYVYAPGTLSNAVLLQGNQGSQGKGVYYAVNPARTLNRFWLVLAAQIFGTGEGNVIENKKTLVFSGTAVPPNDGSYTETTVVNHKYFVPQQTDFNSEARFASPNAYFVAYFAVDGDIITGQNYIKAYIDARSGGMIGPFPNTNLSGFTNDVWYTDTPQFWLTSGTQPHYLQAAYTDKGTKVQLTGDKTVISMPQNAELVNIKVAGPSGGGKIYTSSLMSGTGIEVIANDSGDTNTLSDAQLTGLYNKAKVQRVDNNTTTPTNTERIGIQVNAKMDTSQDIKDLVAYIEAGDFFYKIKLNGTTGIDLGRTDFKDTGADDEVIIPFFGQEYEVIEAQIGTGAQKNITLRKVS